MMDDDKKTIESLEQVFAAGDAWLRQHGIMTSIVHNSVVLNLYSAFPKVRYLEYFLPENGSRKKVWVILYVPFWKLLFSNRDRMMDDVIGFLKDYLPDYDIKVELKRYKKGVETSNEIPKEAADHVSDNGISSSANDSNDPSKQVGPEATATESSASGGSNVADQDPAGTVPAASEPGDVPPIPDSTGA